jgi:hypothetical protein
MRTTLAAHVAELAEVLHDLHRRFRQAARREVAQAVGEALRDWARALIDGPIRYPAPAYAAVTAWDDAWQEAADDPWRGRGTDAAEGDAAAGTRRDAVHWPPALAVGLEAARWGFARTRQVGLAIVLGLIVALAARVAGPTVQSLLEAWSTANDLLSYPGPVWRP